jgi:3-oxoacyl-[acyl-carrier protein] reductase
VCVKVERLASKQSMKITGYHTIRCRTNVFVPASIMTEIRKIAVVTGASRLNGIGAGIAVELASKNIDIFFTYWTKYDQEMPWGIGENEPEQLKNTIEKYGVRCESLELDISEPSAAVKLFDYLEEKLGKASILVNNAAYGIDAGYEKLTAEIIDKHYLVNIRGTMLLSLEFAKRFTNAKGGRIINLTSGQSLGPMIGNIAYATTKGAIEAFTLTLSAEVAAKGITVNAVNPGPTDTGWMDDQTKTHLLTKFPTGRIGTPHDAARLISFIASDESDWITGQVIHSEGGFMRG